MHNFLLTFTKHFPSVTLHYFLYFSLLLFILGALFNICQCSYVLWRRTSNMIACMHIWKVVKVIWKQFFKHFTLTSKVHFPVKLTNKHLWAKKLLRVFSLSLSHLQHTCWRCTYICLSIRYACHYISYMPYLSLNWNWKFQLALRKEGKFARNLKSSGLPEWSKEKS